MALPNETESSGRAVEWRAGFYRQVDEWKQVCLVCCRRSQPRPLPHTRLLLVSQIQSGAWHSAKLNTLKKAVHKPSKVCFIAYRQTSWEWQPGGGGDTQSRKIGSDRMKRQRTYSKNKSQIHCIHIKCVNIGNNPLNDGGDQLRRVHTEWMILSWVGLEGFKQWKNNQFRKDDGWMDEWMNGWRRKGYSLATYLLSAYLIPSSTEGQFPPSPSPLCGWRTSRRTQTPLDLQRLPCSTHLLWRVPSPLCSCDCMSQTTEERTIKRIKWRVKKYNKCCFQGRILLF